MAATTPPLSWSNALALPGFMPDAIPFAARTTLSLLLAYAIAFVAQVEPASSAGICVGIVAQPSAGMSLSKAWYRFVGTVLGCILGVALLAAFPQDRTVLLLGFIVWMGLCAGAATLLRDFRSYAAALSGYTVAIIAIGAIDTPDQALLAALNRTAAICIGIGSVMVVNLLFGGSPALGALTKALTERTATVAAMAQDALRGRPAPSTMAVARLGAGIAALHTEATYAAVEQPAGRKRGDAARFTLGALLGSLNASQVLAAGLAKAGSAPVRAWLDEAADALAAGRAPPEAPQPATPHEAMLLDRAGAILARQAEAATGLRTLESGEGDVPRTRLPISYDGAGFLISGIRTIIAVALGAGFCVAAGWSGATLMLIQQAAFVGLLGASPTPVASIRPFFWPLAPVGLVIGLANYLVLPSASGFLPFSLVVGPAMFVTALLVRGKSLAPFAAPALIYVTLLLSPANVETFDLETYLNTFLQVFGAVLFTFLSFALILPVSPKRRLHRVALQVNQDMLRVQAGRAARLDEVAALSVLYDRLARALTWTGRATPSRAAFLRNLSRTGAAGLALRRARTALDALDAPTAGPARAALRALQPDALDEAAMALPDTATGRLAAATLAELSLIAGMRPPLLRQHQLLDA